ncbi:hypothetical protein Q9233_007294 [Columba guinea]|nr:hypothetical protein Q9233_007294 [Columba guinea]
MEERGTRGGFGKDTVDRLLRRHFRDRRTRVNGDALLLMAEMLKVFVREAAARAARQAQAEELRTVDMEHVEKVLPQLVLAGDSYGASSLSKLVESNQLTKSVTFDVACALQKVRVVHPKAQPSVRPSRLLLSTVTLHERCPSCVNSAEQLWLPCTSDLWGQSDPDTAPEPGHSPSYGVQAQPTLHPLKQ